MKLITVQLTKMVEYNHENKDIEGNHVDLEEPSGKVSHICADIEGIAQEAVAKSASLLPASVIEAAAQEKEKDSEDGEDEQMDGETLLKMVAAGGGNMGKMTLLFKELLKSVGKIGGEKLMTQSIIERLSHKDLRHMMGEYIANFVYL